MKQFGGPVGRRIRTYLTREISGRIDELSKTLNGWHDSVLNHLEGLHGKLDDLRGRVDQLQLRADQLVSRMVIDIDTATVMLRTPFGYLFAPKSDPQLIALLAESGLSGVEPGTRQLLLRLIEPGMTVIDAGANVGALTLPIARAVSETGHVLAFEPTPSVCALLRRSLLLNGLSDRVAIHEMALGRTNGRVPLHLSEVTGHNSLYVFDPDYAFASHARVIDVEMRRLDDVVLPGTRIHIVKLDVEGAELDVLSGMERVLAENPDLAIVAEFGPSHLKRTRQSSDRWIGSFRERGFGLFVIDERNGDVSACDDARLAGVYSVNILAIRRGGAFSAKLEMRGGGA
jgi:FkbM family methyltransferase